MNVTLENGAVLPSLSLRSFCEAVLSDNSGVWPPGETSLADKFVSFFGLSPIPQLAELEALCRRLGVEIAITKLPAELRGHNFSHQGRHGIFITDMENISVAMGSREHTLLHELRELIEYEFFRLGKPTAAGTELERRAEEFASYTRIAASVQMWEPMFGSATQIQSKLLSIAAIIGLVFIVLFYGFACLALPRFEEALRKLIRKLNITKRDNGFGSERYERTLR